MPRWAIVAAVVAALVPATYLTVQRIVDDPGTSGHSSTDLPIPPVTTSTGGPGGSSPTAAPTTQPTTPAKHLPKIAPDAPRRITSGSAIDSGFDSSVTDLDASSDSEVARWDPRGSPGSPGTDTVYVLGRVRADGAFAGLTKLDAGATVVIRTDAGTLTYTVREARLKTEAGLAGQPLFTTHQPGRLVLVGIRYDASGDRLGKALVVVAELTGAKKS